MFITNANRQPLSKLVLSQQYAPIHYNILSMDILYMYIQIVICMCMKLSHYAWMPDEHAGTQ